MMKSIEKKERKNPFSVPEDYFEKVTEGLIDSVKETETGEKRSIITLMKPHLTFAAAMIALVIISYTGLRLILPSDRQGYHDIADLTEYLSSEVSQDLIIEEIVALNDEYIPEELPAGEIVDYLLENGVDFNLLVENF